MKILFATSFLLLISSPLNAEVNNAKHKKCLQAADYQGCMDFQGSVNKSKSNISTQDCSRTLCSPNDLKPSTDNLGMRVIEGWFFKENPADRVAYYYDPNIYRLNSGGQTGRFFHMRSIIRYFRKGSSGTSGYFSSSGNQAIDCHQSLYGNINCTIDSPSLNYVPGTPGRAPDVFQERVDVIYDCLDETVSKSINHKIKRIKGLDGKKRKWQSWDNMKEGSIGYMLITSKKHKKLLRNNLCKNIGVNEDKIFSSDLLQYREKGIKKGFIK